MRKPKLTKDLITINAIELFAEYGIEKVSMNDIARKLSISKPAIYYYFKNKEDIILYAFSKKINEMKNVLKNVSKKKDLRGYMYSLIESYYKFFSKNSTNVKCFFKVLDLDNLKKLEGLMKDVVDEMRDRVKNDILSFSDNRVKKNVNEVSVFISSIISYIMMEIKMKREIDIHRIRKVIDIFIKGISVFFISLNIHSAEIDEEKAVSIAFEKNISIQNAISAEAITKERVREYYGTSYPQINLSVTYTDNIEKPLAFMGGRKVEMGMKNTYSFNLSLSQIIWSGGKVGSAISIAKIYSEISNQQVLLSKNAIRKSVRQLFYTLLYMNEVVKLKEDMLSIEKQHLAMFEEKYKQGLASDLNLIRQKVEVLNKEVELVKAHNAYQITLLAFKNLLGIDLDEDVKLSGKFEYTEREITFPTLYYEALVNRPDYRIAVLQRDMAFKTIEIDKASHYPTLSLFANRQFSGANERNAFPPESLRGWSLVAGLSLNMSLFSGFSITARIKQSEKNLEIAERNIKDIERRIRIEIKEAELNLKEIRKRIEATRLSLENAKKVLNSTEERFKSGLASQLELNDATLLYSSARMNYLNSVFDYITQIINIDYIAGNHGGKNEK